MSDRQVETYELTTNTERNLATALTHRQADILVAAARSVREDSGWMTRAKLTLVSSQCDPLLKTQKGVRTALEAITNAAMVGLSFGGPKPQAYFVPKDGGVLMIPTAAGIRHAVCYGVGAILKTVPELITVRAGDGVKINPMAGTVEYSKGGYDPFAKDRGKIAGWIMRLEFRDERPAQVRHVTLEKVRQIEDRYGGKNNPMYAKSPEEADEKTAIKYLLRDCFAEAAGLAQMILEGDEADERPAVVEPPKVERNVTERLGGQLDKATASMKSVEVVESEEEPEDVAAEEDEHPIETDEDGKPLELF